MVVVSCPLSAHDNLLLQLLLVNIYSTVFPTTLESTVQSVEPVESYHNQLSEKLFDLAARPRLVL